MLEVVMYKTFHSGEQQARHLLDPIRNSDCFSPELLSMTVKKASNFESAYARALSSNISRSKFNSMLQIGGATDNPRAIAYIRKTLDNMYRQKSGLYFLERYRDDQELSRVKGLSGLASSEVGRGVFAIKQGNIDEGIDLCFEGELKREEARELRDRNVAENLKTAEEAIRNSYEGLREQEIIRLGIQRGAAHSINKYSDIEITETDPIGESRESYLIEIEIGNLISQGAERDQLVDLFIRRAELATSEMLRRV